METKQLNHYKVFLASSYELEDERNDFFQYTIKINKVLAKFGYQIDVEAWEFADPALPDKRSQDEYNKILKNCDECIVLFWRKAGKYSKEELKIAYNERFGGGKITRLVVYFKDVKDGDMPKDEKGKKEFEKLIKVKNGFAKKHSEKFYSSYRDIEGVESDFLLFFIGKNLPAAKLSIQDSKIMLDGQELGNVSNLSLAYNNKPYQKLSKEVSDLEKDLLSLKTSNPKSSSIPLCEKELSGKKKELQNFEKALMEMAQTITRITTADPDDKRVALAQKEFEEGNYHNALGILNREEILADAAQCEKDFETAKALADKAKEKYRAKIETIVLRIQYLSIAKFNNWFNECKELYELAVFHARKCYSNAKLASLLYDYADFLHKNNIINDSIKKYEEILAIYYKLSITMLETYLPDLATALNDLGILYKKTNNLSEAEVKLMKALHIRSKLANTHTNSYHLADLAATLNNLGNLHIDLKKLSSAEEELKESLNIYQKLYQITPMRYLYHMALTLNNLGRLHFMTNDFINAEKEFKEALGFFRQLRKDNPIEYQHYIGIVQNHLGTLHWNIGKYAEAEKEYIEALDILQKLAESSPEAYLPYVAQTLFNFALLRMEQGKLSEAAQMAQESLEKYQTMAKLSPAAFDQYVEKAKNLLEKIRAKQAEEE